MSTDPFDSNPRKPLSVSQYKTYEQCPQRWFLSKVERAWQRPAAWLAQGTAVHAAIEAWERSGRSMPLEAVQDVFRAEYKKEVDEACGITPNFEWWFKSGPYAGEADLIRRFQIGLEQCAKYLAWANGHPEEATWTTPSYTDPRCTQSDQSQAISMNPGEDKMLVHVQGCDCREGTPAIELGFDIELDGTPVRGYIDAIIEVEVSPGVWELRVRDHKTGNNPGDDFQLGVYAVAIGELFDTSPESGDYWMGRSGKPTYPFDLSDWTKDRVAEKFRELEENIAAERFDPKPDPDKCRFCDVSYTCQYAV